MTHEAPRMKDLTATLVQKEYGHFIDGAWVEGSNGKTLPLVNPATQEVLTHIQAGSPVDVKHAVDAAARAFPKWSKTSPQERQAVLMEMGRRLKARSLDYGMMETLNNGKPIAETQFFDLPQTISTFELYAGAAYSLKGSVIDMPDASCFVHREPLGVCAQIIPWNVPLLMTAVKIAPALAAGNTVVLKPAETVCLSVLEFFREIADLLPPGVVNVVTGYGAEVGEALVTDPRVRKVSFTGSKATASSIMKYASVNIIPQTLELGGKSANIVCEDADLDAAVESAALVTVFNKGEVCLAGSRVFVHKKIYDVFLEKLQAVMKGIRIGDPMDMATQLGPQASRAQFDKVCSYLKIGKDEGAKILAGGQAAKVAGFEKGFFIEPTVFFDVDNNMRIAREEIFGPVTCIIPWDNEDDVIRMANDSHYGLAAGVWTRDITRAHRMSRNLESGTVWVNGYYNIIAGAPTGGYKQSGFGREFALETLDHYSQTKTVTVNLREGPLHLFS